MSSYVGLAGLLRRRPQIWDEQLPEVNLPQPQFNLPQRELAPPPPNPSWTNGDSMGDGMGEAQAATTAPTYSNPVTALTNDPRATPPRRGGIWREIGAGVVGGLLGSVAGGAFRPLADNLAGRIRYGSEPWNQHQQWADELSLSQLGEQADRQRDTIEYNRANREYMNSLREQQQATRKQQAKDMAFDRAMRARSTRMGQIQQAGGFQDFGDQTLQVKPFGPSVPVGPQPEPPAGPPTLQQELQTTVPPSLSRGIGAQSMTVPAGPVIPGALREVVPGVVDQDGRQLYPDTPMLTPPKAWWEEQKARAQGGQAPKLAEELGLDQDTVLTRAQIRAASDETTAKIRQMRDFLVGSKGGTIVRSDGSREVVAGTGGNGGGGKAPASTPKAFTDQQKTTIERQMMTIEAAANEELRKELAQAERDKGQLVISPMLYEERLKRAHEGHAEKLRLLEEAKRAYRERVQAQSQPAQPTPTTPSPRPQGKITGKLAGAGVTTDEPDMIWDPATRKTIPNPNKKR